MISVVYCVHMFQVVLEIVLGLLIFHTMCKMSQGYIIRRSV